jgi:hypothetical protein
MGAMPTLAVGMWRVFRSFNMPMASVGIGTQRREFPQEIRVRLGKRMEPQ